MKPLIGVATLTAQLRELGTAWVSTIVGYDMTEHPQTITKALDGLTNAEVRILAAVPVADVTRALEGLIATQRRAVTVTFTGPVTIHEGGTVDADALAQRAAHKLAWKLATAAA